MAPQPSKLPGTILEAGARTGGRVVSVSRGAFSTANRDSKVAHCGCDYSQYTLPDRDGLRPSNPSGRARLTLSKAKRVSECTGMRI